MDHEEEGDPWVGAGEHLPIHAGTLTGLTLYRSCVGNIRYCEFLRVISGACPDDGISKHPLHLLALTLSHLL